NGSLRIDTLGRNVVAEKFEQSILTADLSDSGVFAVAFDDSEYASTVSVFDKRGSTPPLLQLSYSGEDVTAVKLSPNGKTLATVTVRSEGGAFSSCLRLYKVKTGQKLCEETVSGSMAVTLIGYADRVFMASPSGLLGLNWEGGDRRTYDVTNVKYLAGEGSKHLCVAFDPSGGRQDTVLLIDRKGEETARFTIEGDYRRLCISDEWVYARYADHVDVYDFTGALQGTFAVGYETGFIAPCGRGLAVTADMELRYYE
ncbi:MAG: WD40 repeat domain-containing protein, partial [Clostridia bacterium]|nr:WD40 repeat domain-containing protein [Clostridia bacterium]